MRSLNLEKLLTISIIIGVIISFWIFARFTVDDAFISWRYGKNLADFGIWNYSPNILDMTQAYTNPIYAILSIVPNYFNIDVVLFFKIVSLLNLFLFVVYMIKKTGKYKTVLLFFILPATMIHLFSGLETFLFVSLLVVLFVNLYENNFKSSILITILLFLTRPETWLFVALTPFYFLIKNLEIDFSNIKIFFQKLLIRDNFNFKDFFISIIILGFVLGSYFLFHKYHFGYALPNTFYIKSGSFFNPILFIWFAIVAIPLVVIFSTKKYHLFIIFTLFFFALILSYSTSDLQMNYAERFAYHIFAPLFFILIFLSTKLNEPIYYISKMENGKPFFILKPNLYLNVIAIIFLTLFFFKSTNISTIKLSDYYPRGLDSHAELGKKLNEIKNKYGVKSFSQGDAGMTAYHSELLALDNIGLGSSMVAQSKEVNYNILNQYNPEILSFHAKPGEIFLDSYSQKTILEWGKERNYKYRCDVYWRKDYTMAIYSKDSFDELQQVCKSSEQLNNISSKDYILKMIKKSPFSYWHE
ncbi:MAG: hypothetical protein KBE77_08880 [Aliarcobacter sp.]|nr:hypothetical protein [Aliarcobacter sp.]